MTDSEKSGVRINALMNELDRLQYEIRKKKMLIRMIVSVTVLAILILVAAFSNRSKFDSRDMIQVNRENNELVKERVHINSQHKSFQLVFGDLNQYPLARFFNEKDAVDFQEEIKKLHLPETHIHVDTLSGKERVLSVSSNYRYYIQFGIFKKKLIPDLPDNMVYLHQINETNLYKYRLGPFSKTKQAEELINKLKLKDYLIVEVSN
ncbi:SPOR domain-containing protein [Ancylomarina salipaludis]|uniref:SPOR domain-containing protein n=1 Tax=Ancylomarina salipaludis TaxID=2501299 RepID=A0A4Q1JNM6_9BACT|nr:SPOR domain-containing protein [Ancylomarina salipaludis]RXQ96478.1 SPOR domain-containing protein [Ancylomarina salipaludis]